MTTPDTFHNAATVQGTCLGPQAFLRLRPCPEMRLQMVQEAQRQSHAQSGVSRPLFASFGAGANRFSDLSRTVAASSIGRTREQFLEWFRATLENDAVTAASAGRCTDSQTRSHLVTPSDASVPISNPSSTASSSLSGTTKRIPVRGTFELAPAAHANPLRLPHHVHCALEHAATRFAGRTFSIQHRQADVFSATIKPHISSTVLSGGNMLYIATGGCQSDRSFTLYGMKPDGVKSSQVIATSNHADRCAMPIDHPLSIESFIPASDLQSARRLAHIAFSAALQNSSSAQATKLNEANDAAVVVSVPPLLGDIATLDEFIAREKEPSQSRPQTVSSAVPTPTTHSHESLSIGVIHLAADALLRGVVTSTGDASLASDTALVTAKQLANSQRGTISVYMSAMAVIGSECFDILDTPRDPGEVVKPLTMLETLEGNRAKFTLVKSEKTAPRSSLLEVQLLSPMQVTNLLLTASQNLSRLYEKRQHQRGLASHGSKKEPGHDTVTTPSDPLRILTSEPRELPHIVVELKVTVSDCGPNLPTCGRLVFIDVAPLDVIQEHSMTAANAAALADSASLVVRIAESGGNDTSSLHRALQERMQSSTLTKAISSILMPVEGNPERVSLPLIVSVAHLTATSPSRFDATSGEFESGVAAGSIPLNVTHGAYCTLSYLMRTCARFQASSQEGAQSTYNSSRFAAFTAASMTYLPQYLLNPLRASYGGSRALSKALTDLSAVLLQAVEAELHPGAQNTKSLGPRPSPSAASLRLLSPAAFARAGTTTSSNGPGLATQLNTLAVALGYAVGELRLGMTSAASTLSSELFDNPSIVTGVSTWSVPGTLEALKQQGYSASGLALLALSASALRTLNETFAKIPAEYASFQASKQQYQQVTLMLAHRHFARAFEYASTALAQNLGHGNFLTYISFHPSATGDSSCTLSVRFQPTSVISWVRDGCEFAPGRSLTLGGRIGLPWDSPSVIALRRGVATQLELIQRTINEVLASQKQLTPRTSKQSHTLQNPMLRALKHLHAVSIYSSLSGPVVSTPKATPERSPRHDSIQHSSSYSNPVTKADPHPSHVRARSASRTQVLSAWRLAQDPVDASPVVPESTAGHDETASKGVVSDMPNELNHLGPITSLVLPSEGDLASLGEDFGADRLETELQAALEQLDTMRSEYAVAQERIAALEATNTSLQTELTSVKATLNRHLGLFGYNPTVMATNPPVLDSADNQPMRVDTGSRPGEDSTTNDRGSMSASASPSMTTGSDSRLLIEVMQQREMKFREELQQARHALSELAHQRRNEAQQAQATEAALSNRIVQLENSVTVLNNRLRSIQTASGTARLLPNSTGPESRLALIELETANAALQHERDRLLEENAQLRAQLAEFMSKRMPTTPLQSVSQSDTGLNKVLQKERKAVAARMATALDTISTLRDVCHIATGELKEALNVCRSLSDAIKIAAAGGPKPQPHLDAIAAPGSSIQGVGTHKIDWHEVATTASQVLESLTTSAFAADSLDSILAVARCALQKVSTSENITMDLLPCGPDTESTIKTDADAGRGRLLAETAKRLREARQVRSKLLQLLHGEDPTKVSPTTERYKHWGDFAQSSGASTRFGQALGVSSSPSKLPRPKSATVAAYRSEMLKSEAEQAPLWASRYEPAQHSLPQSQIATSPVSKSRGPVTSGFSGNSMELSSTKITIQPPLQRPRTAIALSRPTLQANSDSPTQEVNSTRLPEHSHAAYPGQSGQRPRTAAKLITPAQYVGHESSVPARQTQASRPASANILRRPLNSSSVL